MMALTSVFFALSQTLVIIMHGFCMVRLLTP